MHCKGSMTHVRSFDQPRGPTTPPPPPRPRCTTNKTDRSRPACVPYETRHNYIVSLDSMLHHPFEGLDRSRAAPLIPPICKKAQNVPSIAGQATSDDPDEVRTNTSHQTFKKSMGLTCAVKQSTHPSSGFLEKAMAKQMGG